MQDAAGDDKQVEDLEVSEHSRARVRLLDGVDHAGDRVQHATQYQQQQWHSRQPVRQLGRGDQRQPAEDDIERHAQPAWPKPLVDSDQASLEVRRSGPLVALVSGDAIPEESHKLLQMVHFEDTVTSIPQPTESEVTKTGKLLMGIATLVIIGSAAAILLGFFLGGGRALYRIARGKPASSVYETEFIRLNLQK